MQLWVSGSGSLLPLGCCLLILFCRVRRATRTTISLGLGPLYSGENGVLDAANQRVWIWPWVRVRRRFGCGFSKDLTCMPALCACRRTLLEEVIDNDVPCTIPLGRRRATRCQRRVPVVRTHRYVRRQRLGLEIRLKHLNTP